VASAGQKDVITLGAGVSTVQITHIAGGWESLSTAKSGNVKLLDGLVTAKSVTTRASVTEVAGQLATHTTTTFVGLQVVGTNLPAKIPANYQVKLGTKASMVLNAGAGDVATGAAQAVGAGIRLQLLEPAGRYAAGAVVSVSPVESTVQLASGATGHTNKGLSYGSELIAPKGSTLTGYHPGQTAPVTVFAHGTRGSTVKNSLAGEHLAAYSQIGGVLDTGVGTNTTSGAITTTSSKVADINLFDGLIKADKVSAQATAASNGPIKGQAQWQNLRVGDVVIPLNARPNTTMNVGALGKVTVDRQIRTAHGITVRALDLVLTTPRDGLPVGTEVQIGVAQAAAT
jgi:hypothetical protein